MIDDSLSALASPDIDMARAVQHQSNMSVAGARLFFFAIEREYA